MAGRSGVCWNGPSPQSATCAKQSEFHPVLAVTVSSTSTPLPCQSNADGAAIALLQAAAMIRDLHIVLDSETEISLVKPAG
ncbi:hypothetical protein [Agrobacterium sp. 22-223-1]